MSDSLPIERPPVPSSRGQVCPECGTSPSHAAEVLNRGVMIATYAHDDHMWNVRWISL